MGNVRWKANEIEFLKENYEVEHTLSFDNVVEDISILCRRNGGIL